jgi:hypothetical protein
MQARWCHVVLMAACNLYRLQRLAAVSTPHKSARANSTAPKLVKKQIHNSLASWQQQCHQLIARDPGEVHWHNKCVSAHGIVHPEHGLKLVSCCYRVFVACWMQVLLGVLAAIRFMQAARYT